MAAVSGTQKKVLCYMHSKPMSPKAACLRQIHLSQLAMEKAAWWYMKLGCSKSKYLVIYVIQIAILSPTNKSDTRSQ